MSSEIVRREILSETTARYIVAVLDDFDGGQVLFRFPNGWGASVIRHSHSYGGASGLFELAVLRWSGEPEDMAWELDYSTPVTSDVLGWLSPREVEENLLAIRALSARELTNAG